MNTFGAKLRLLRKQKGLSQEEVAKYLGYSRVQVSNWEIERSEPDIQALGKLAEFYGVTIDSITGTASPSANESAPITTEPIEQTIDRMNDPVMDGIIDNLQQMSPDERETFWRLSQSVVNRTTKGIS